MGVGLRRKEGSVGFVENSLRNKGDVRVRNVRAKKVQCGCFRKVEMAVGQ